MAESIQAEVNIVDLPKEIDPSIQDGGVVLFRCSDCRAKLMEIWRTRPNEPETYYLQAKCPYCGDHSPVTAVKGGFSGPAGIVEVSPDQPDDPREVTSFIGFDFEEQSVRGTKVNVLVCNLLKVGDEKPRK